MAYANMAHPDQTAGWSGYTLFVIPLSILTLKLLIVAIIVLEGYANSKTCPTYDTQMQPFRASAPIQEGTYFHTNTLLFIIK